MLNGSALREDGGGSAIEFALLAPMLMALVFGTIEIGAMEMMSTNLDAAVLTAARRIRTGDPNRATNASGFVSQVCAGMSDSLANCTARLTVSVRKFSSFTTLAQSAAAAPTGAFDANGPGDIMLVKANYSWPLVLPGYGGGFQTQGPTKAILSTSTTFKNEPYG